jgi:hypothetical protein
MFDYKLYNRDLCHQNLLDAYIKGEWNVLHTIGALVVICGMAILILREIGYICAPSLIEMLLEKDAPQ